MASSQGKNELRDRSQRPPGEPQHPLEPEPPFYEPDSMVKLTGEGPVHIARTGTKKWAVTWAPYSFAGGALSPVELEAEKELHRFLQKDLHIEDDDVKKAMNDLASFGRASIQRVRLNPREAKRLGLMADTPN